MAQTVAASGNSAGESSWETASDNSSPARSTGGGSQLARLPATPAWGRERTADAGLDMAADGACADTTRGEAAAVAAKRKQPDAGAAEKGPAAKRCGSGRAVSTTSSKWTSLGSEGSTSEDRPFSSRNESSGADASAGGEPDMRERLAAFYAAADAQEAASSGATDWDWALESAAADLLARASAPAAGPARQPAGGRAAGSQLPLLQTQPQLVSTAPGATAAAAAAAAVAEAEQATVHGSSGVGSPALKRAARQPLPGGLSAPTATQGPHQGSQSQAPTPAFSSGDPAQEKARAATAQAATLQRQLDSERAATARVRRLIEEMQAAAAAHRSAARRCAATEAARQCAEADASDARAELAPAKAELARKEAAVLKAVQCLLDAAS